MEPGSSLAAAAIVELAFKKFIESSAGELAKKFTEGAIAKMDVLRERIAEKLRGKPKAEQAIAAVETGAKSAIDQLVPYLHVAMDDDAEFAQEIQRLAQDILILQRTEGRNIQNIHAGQGFQVNDPTAPVIQGGSGNTININYGASQGHSAASLGTTMKAKKILFLAANPKTTSRLRLDEEVREIEEGLKRSRQRDQFTLGQKWAVRSRDMRRAMLEIKPDIIHFSGHGAEDKRLILEDDSGKPQFVTPEALAGLFELFADSVECVVLNVCYSDDQAEAIARHIPYVIGMSQAIDDSAAIEFSVAFYDALGAGESIEFAYRLACNAIQMAGIEGHLAPVLKHGKPRPAKASENDSRKSPEGAQTKRSAPTNFNQPGADTFVGRDDELKELHMLLQQGQSVSICAVSGMGGIGKTELAVQYALRHQQLQTYPGAICWLNARVDVGTELVKFARTTLNLMLPDLPDLRQQVEWCWGQFPSADCLIVLDDVQDYAEIEPFLPPAESRFKVLMTTRLQNLANVKPLKIEVLSEELALELLRSLVKDERIDQELEQAKQICHWLGCLPLGLELVGRYLARKKDVSLALLWERLQAKKLDAQALKKAEPGMTASLGVAAAFELSWQELNEDAQQLAKVLSLFALAEIPWVLVQQCLPQWDEEELEDLRDEKLLGLHLLTRTNAEMYQLHQLLREFFAAKLSNAERKPLKTAFATTMIGVAKQIPQDPTLELIQVVTAVIPHMKETAEDLKKLKSADELYLQDEDDLSWAFIGIGRFYEGQGLYAEAEPWLQDCLAVVRSLLGEQHPAVASSLNNLAGLYQSQGRYEDAEPLLQQALELMRSLLGEQHPAVATSLNNLAGLYRAQGRYEDAEPLLQQALELYRSLLGEQHPAVATSLNNLAELYRSQGRYEDAEPLYQQAIQIGIQALGEDHPDVAVWFHNLAGLHVTLRRYAEAEPLYLQAISVFYQRLGETHPYTQGTWQSFLSLLLQVAQENRTDELSDHPMTRSLLQQLQDAES
jgi:tetratricopeptide (TPR) repeat protein